MMELGARVCGPRRADCAACPVSAWCANAGVGAGVVGPSATVSAVRSAGAATVEGRRAAAAGARARPRFEDTDRWARGRVVAALLADAPLPALEPARRTRVLAGLARDGLVVAAADGSVRLP